MSIVRVVAVVVDTTQLTLYQEDGTKLYIPQGDPRVRKIVDEALPIVRLKQVAVIDLSIEEPNQYKDFEEQSGGFVRFFRAAKKAVAGIFAPEPMADIPEGEFGVVPDAPAGAPATRDQTAAAVEEIISNARPVTAPEFNVKQRPDETMIAVVGHGADAKIIPGVEAIAGQFDHSAKNRNTTGVQNLLARMAGYIERRGHSVEDLLRFLEKGDLPIADDGSIIAYKRLYRSTMPVEGGKMVSRFVDPHTRKVFQRVGSFVCVNEELVDKNRRNECSSGLHIGRRGYMGSFSGDAIVLCKIAPEDVIVVPHNDPNKVRVCGYHIVAELPREAFDLICRNKPMTQSRELQVLLGDVLAGRHIERIEEVRINGSLGNELVITPLVEGNDALPAATTTEELHPLSTALDDERNAVPAPKPSTVSPKQASSEVVKQATSGRMQRAQQLMEVVQTGSPEHRYEAAQQLLAFKKSTKVGWTVLGITDVQATSLLNVPKPAPKAAPKLPVRKTAPKKKKAPAKAPVAKVEPVKKTEGLSKAHQANMLVLKMADSGLSVINAGHVAKDLLNLRRAAKKSWASLGQPDLTDDQLRKIANDGLAAEMAAQAVAKIKPEPKTIAPLEVPAESAPPVPVTPTKQSRSERARTLFDISDWAALARHKKAVKVGWSKLGFTDAEIQTIKLHTGE